MIYHSQQPRSSDIVSMTSAHIIFLLTAKTQGATHNYLKKDMAPHFTSLLSVKFCPVE